LIVSAHQDSTIKFWNANSFELLRIIKGRFPDLSTVVFSPDGRTIAAGYDESNSRVDIWSVHNGKLKATLATDSDYTHSIAFNSTGTMIVTGHTSDDVKLWNVKTGKLIRTFRQPFSMDDQVAFSPDGNYVVSGGENQNLIVWNIRNGNLVWSAIPVDWEAEKRARQEAAKSAAAVAAAKAENRRKTREADKETFRWRNAVSIVFGHYGEPINPLEQRMMERGNANKSLSLQTAAEATGVWLRITNKSPLPISFSTDSFYLPRLNCGIKLSNGESAAGLCDGAEISIRYQIEESNRRRVPYGLGLSMTSVLPPGVTVMFSVRRDHLQNGKGIFITYNYLKENEEHELKPFGTPRRVTFRSSQLR
jgi:hypothetical protein